MDATQLRNYLFNDIPSLAKFYGIYSIDRLNFALPRKECFLICNTDESFKKGKHWIVIYINSNKNVIEYFDSLGKKPLDKFIDFMMQDNRYILHNLSKLQDFFSDSCGYFCLYFIYFRCRGVDFNSVLNSFSSSVDKNEKYVKEFIKQI